MHIVPNRRAIARGMLFLALSSASTGAFAASATATTTESPWQVAQPWSPQGGGGPDAFGYTWATSEDGGTTFAWIDISTTGTLVTGLGDDNSAVPITLPFSFRYYWTDVTSIRIGSNGWIGLGDSPPINISSCFPDIPTSGGAGDSYLAPLMSDLNFTGAGNPGRVRYLIDTLNQRVIVSYLDVPYWTVAAPGWGGSNTFQVILDANTRSIKYQYQGVSAFTPASSCVDMVVGIEAPQGQIGLQVFNDTLPASNSALEFSYPNPPLIDVIDATPSALTSAGLAAANWYSDTAAPLSATISNEGNTATAGAVSVRGELFDAANLQLYDQTVSVAQLAGGASSIASFPAPPVVPAGHYRFRVTASVAGDINPANDVRDAELVAVPRNQSGVFDYVGAEAATGSLGWIGGPTGPDDTGAGVLFVPPGAGYYVTSLGFFLNSNMGVATKLKLLDNDGPGGLPLTVLAEVTTPVGPFPRWFDIPITPVAVDADGFYVVWFQPNTSMFLGTSSAAPFSRRNFELLAGQYAPWRDNGAREMMLRASVSPDAAFANGFE